MINNIKPNINFLILLAAPLLSLMWHLENNHMPMSDAVGFLESAYAIYMNFASGNYGDFLLSIFNERSWRPVIFQLFMVPFLIISNGDILLSVSLLHTLFASLSVYFVYKIFLKYADKYIAAISSSIICLSIDILFGGEPFTLFAEVSFIPFLLGTIYFLSEEKLFKNKKRSYLFALFFTLTLLSRPVEGVVFITTSLVFIILYKHKNYLSFSEIIKGFIYPVFFLWVLLFSRLVPSVSSSVLKIDPPNSYEIFFLIFCLISALLVIFLALYIYSKRTNFLSENKIEYKTFFSKCMLLSSFILWFWYTPRLGSLYGWVYATSIGGQFQHQKDNIYEISYLLTNAINIHGPLIIYVVFILFILSIFLYLFDINFNLKKVNFYKKFFNNVNLLILTSIPIPVILYFTTWQITYRKIAPVVTLILIFMLINIIQYKKIKNISYAVLTMVFLLQSYTLLSHIYNDKKNDRWVNHNGERAKIYILGSYFPYPVNTNEDPHKNLINFLSKNTKEKKPEKIALVFDDSAYPIEPYLTKFLCNNVGLNCTFTSPKKFMYGNIDYLNDHDSFVIINNYDISEDNANNIDTAKNYIDERTGVSSSAELYSYYLNYLYVANELNIHNINVKECDIIYKKYKACLLIKD